MHYWPLPLLLVLLLSAMHPALGATNEGLEEQLALMQRMLDQSDSAKRISSSDEASAQDRLQKARELLVHARTALRDGDLEQAAALLDRASNTYVAAAGALSQGTGSNDPERTRFNELSVSIESFRLYLQEAAVKSGEDNPLDQQQLNRLLQLASRLRQEGNYAEANSVLSEAYMHTITAVSALKGGDTIVYSQDFATPEQEYAYQLERYRGLQQLLDMISPGEELPSEYRWAARSLEGSQQDFIKARERAAEQEFQKALQNLDAASRKLTWVLRLLGLPIAS